MSALDYALDQSESAQRRPGEFTSSEFYAGLLAKNVSISHSGAMYRLKEMVTGGKLKKRKITLGGSPTNLYSKP